MKYTVKYAAAASKDIRAFPPDVLDRLDARIAEIEANPFNPRISKLLKGPSGLRSSRVGHWRVLYLADSETWWVIIARIQHRREVYRDL